MSNGWIGVDLDGTLAVYNGWNGGVIGEPIKPMLERVKNWLAEGREVRIMTARVGPQGPKAIVSVEAMREDVEDWCEKHIGTRLQVTNEKDYAMLELWDDRCVQVVKNTGELTTLQHNKLLISTLAEIRDKSIVWKKDEVQEVLRTINTLASFAISCGEVPD